MAIQDLSLDLGNFNFPVVSNMRGKPVIIPGLDQERKSPQPYWLENIMPVQDGVITVGYTEQIGSVANAAILGVPEIGYPAMKNANVYKLVTEEGTSTYYLTTTIYHFLYDTLNNEWIEVEDSVSLGSSDSQTSVFFYKGRTILFNPNIGFWSYDYDTSTGYSKTTEVTNGITVANITTATASGSYIILGGEETVYWSSPLSGDNPGDTIEFDPANLTLTGAGSTNILALKGEITVAVPKPNGFYVYTNQNAISVTSTGNSSNPWRFDEVRNSGGVFRTELISYENNADIHFVWGDLGLVSVAGGRAQQQFPQLTELFTGSVWEYWNSGTKQIVQELGVNITVKLAFVTGRYLCFSYGKEGQAKEYVLVLDTSLQRWGKLKVNHLDVFDSTPPAVTLDASKQAGNMLAIPANTLLNDPAFNYLEGTAERNFRSNTIAVLTEDYEIQTVDFTQQTNMGTGLFIYGGIATTRTRVSELNAVEVDGIWETAAPDLTVELKTTENPTWSTATWETTSEQFLADSVGKEHSLKVEGQFELSSLVVAVTNKGRR